MRLFRDKRTRMENFDNDGLYISEPFFEEEYYYDPITMQNDKNYNPYADDFKKQN